MRSLRILGLAVCCFCLYRSGDVDTVGFAERDVDLLDPIGKGEGFV